MFSAPTSGRGRGGRGGHNNNNGANTNNGGANRFTSPMSPSAPPPKGSVGITGASLMGSYNGGFNGSGSAFPAPPAGPAPGAGQQQHGGHHHGGRGGGGRGGHSHNNMPNSNASVPTPNNTNNAAPSGPTNTLKVTITSVMYPVTEEVLRSVFSAIAPVVGVTIVSTQEPAVALVQFPDANSADMALRARNGRNIYNDCLTMAITFAHPPTPASANNANNANNNGFGVMGGMPGGNNGAPFNQQNGFNNSMGSSNGGNGAAAGGGMGGANNFNGSASNMPPNYNNANNGGFNNGPMGGGNNGFMGNNNGGNFNNNNNAGGFGGPNNNGPMGMNGGFNNNGMMPGNNNMMMNGFNNNNPMQQGGPNNNGFNNNGMGNNNGPMGFSTSNGSPLGGGPSMMGGYHNGHNNGPMGGNMMMGGNGGPFPMMGGLPNNGMLSPNQTPSLTIGNGPNSIVIGGDYGRGRGGVMLGGGRGRGGGASSMGMMPVPPMAVQIGMGNPSMMGGAHGRGGAGGMLGGGNTAPSNQNMANADGVFISVASYDASQPLQPLFTLLESFGGVVSMRRGQQKPNVITVKVASLADADALCRLVRRIPINGADISCKPFPTYVNRNPPNDSADPMDPSVTAHDFTKSRHRNPQQRCMHPAGPEVIITGCASKSESDLMTYLSDKSLFPENVEKNEDEGVFTVKFDTTANAVKCLVECQFNVCGSEKANIVFAEPANPIPTPGAEGAASTAAH